MWPGQWPHPRLLPATTPPPPPPLAPQTCGTPPPPSPTKIPLVTCPNCNMPLIAGCAIFYSTWMRNSGLGDEAGLFTVYQFSFSPRLIMYIYFGALGLVLFFLELHLTLTERCRLVNAYQCGGCSFRWLVFVLELAFSSGIYADTRGGQKVYLCPQMYAASQRADTRSVKLLGPSINAFGVGQ